MIAEISFGKYRYAHILSRTPNKHDFEKHLHNLYEILFVKEGCHEYFIDNKKILFKPYDLIIVPPGTFHFINIISDQPYERHVLNFSEDGLPKELLDRIFEDSKHFSLAADDTICGIFERLDRYAAKFQGEEQRLICHATLLELLLNISTLKESESNQCQYIDGFLEKILKYIDDNLAEIENVEEIANYMFISKSHLFSSFKKAMGVSLMHYIKNKRIFHAQALLKSGVPPTKAYLQCGFKDYSTFYRCYCKFVGSPPSMIFGSDN